MNFKYFFLILILCVALIGCGRHCFGVSGDYKGIEGTIEYCYDVAKSKEEGRPVFLDNVGEKLTGLLDSDLAAIVEIIKDKAKDMVGIKSAPPPIESTAPPLKIILTEIKAWQKAKMGGKDNAGK